MNEKTGMVEINFREDAARAERAPDGAVELFLNLSGRSDPRPIDTLASELQEIQANKPKDVYDKLELAVEGTFTRQDGEEGHTLFPVKGGHSFTFDEIVRNDPELFRYYVMVRLCDHLARLSPSVLPASRGLSLDQIQVLEKTAETLARSKQAKPNATEVKS